MVPTEGTAVASSAWHLNSSSYPVTTSLIFLKVKNILQGCELCQCSNKAEALFEPIRPRQVQPREIQPRQNRASIADAQTT